MADNTKTKKIVDKKTLRKIKKRFLVNHTKKRTLINKSRKSRIKTFIKNISNLIVKGETEKALELFPSVQSEIARGVTKQTFHLRRASRKISQLAKRINVQNKLSA